MSRYVVHRTLSSFAAALVLLLAAAPAAAQTRPEPVRLQKIWDGAPHSAFTDIARFENRWYVTFREGERHVHGGDGTIRVLASDDGETWESVLHMIEEGIDLRDPKLSVTPDGRLMLLMGGSVYDSTRLVTKRPRVVFSDDGRLWTPPMPVLQDGEWLWRVTWHDDRAYGVSYYGDRSIEEWHLTLFAGADGLRYDSLATLLTADRPNETTLRFLPDGTMAALVRREAGNRHAWIGTSRHPFTEWTWHDSGHSLGGPNFIVLPNGEMWAAGRSSERTTVLGRLYADRFEPMLTLPSGGDTSYPGLAWHDGMLWISYYSSHEGKSAIYLAQVRLP